MWINIFGILIMLEKFFFIYALRANFDENHKKHISHNVFRFIRNIIISLALKKNAQKFETKKYR